MTEAMKLVPVEPTEAMMDAADGPFHQTVADMRAANKRMGHQVDAMASEPFAKALWQAMLQASPVGAGDSPPMTTPDPVALVERLLKVESGNADYVTGLCTNWHRNPDGPEAAAVIQDQAERIAELEAGLRPFAALAETPCKMNGEPYLPSDGEVVPAGCIVWGYIRQARALLPKATK